MFQNCGTIIKGVNMYNENIRRNKKRKKQRNIGVIIVEKFPKLVTDSQRSRNLITPSKRSTKNPTPHHVTM